MKLRLPDKSRHDYLFKTGISLTTGGHGVVWSAAVTTAITAIPFIVVQGAAFVDSSQSIADEDDEKQDKAINKEKPFVLCGFALSSFFFLAYLAWSYKTAMTEDSDSASKLIKDEKQNDRRQEAMRGGQVGVGTAVWTILHCEDETELFTIDGGGQQGGYGSTQHQQEERSGLATISVSMLKSYDGGSRFRALKETLRPFFEVYAGSDMKLDLRELASVFVDGLNERKSQAELTEIFKVFDNDGSGDLDLDGG